MTQTLARGGWPSSRSRSRWRPISARVSRWSTACGRAGCRWPWRERSAWTTTTRSCVYYVGAAAVRGLHVGRVGDRRAGGRRRRGVQRRDGADADGPDRRGPAPLRAPPGRGPAGAAPGRAGRPGAGRPRPGARAAPPATARSAARLARRLGLDDAVCDALAHAFERWDGKGHPAGLAGEEVPVAVRIVAAARDAELFARRAGWPAAVDVLVTPAWPRLRPCRRRRARWTAGRAGWPSSATIRARRCSTPSRRRCGRSAPTTSTRALSAIADFADLKSPWFRGHSAGVAELAAAAAEAAGLPPAEATTLRPGRAGARRRPGRDPERDLGPSRPAHRRAVGAGPAPPVPERARAAVAAASSAPFAALAGRHHERADGSGYHRGLGGDQLDVGRRLLAAADAYHAMTEDRPHRPALARPTPRRQLLRARSTPAASAAREVDAVLAAAGHAGRVGRGPRIRPGSPTARSRCCGSSPAATPTSRWRPQLGISPEDRRPPRRAHLRQGRRHHPGRGDALRHGARPARTLTARP